MTLSAERAGDHRVAGLSPRTEEVRVPVSLRMGDIAQVIKSH